jgi:hypothetical protein
VTIWRTRSRSPDVHLSCLFDNSFQGGPYISAALIEQRQCMRMTIDGISTDAVFSGDPGRADPVHECEVDFFASGMSAYEHWYSCRPGERFCLSSRPGLQRCHPQTCYGSICLHLVDFSSAESRQTLTGGLSPSVPRGFIKTDFGNQFLFSHALTRTTIASRALISASFAVFKRIRLAHASANLFSESCG